MIAIVIAVVAVVLHWLQSSRGIGADDVGGAPAGNRNGGGGDGAGDILDGTSNEHGQVQRQGLGGSCADDAESVEPRAFGSLLQPGAPSGREGS